MAAEDDVRKKSHELHSLTQELQEHLSSNDETGWLEGKVHGTLGKLRQTLESMESELDIDPSQGSPTEMTEPEAKASEPQVTRPKVPGTLTPEDFPLTSGKGLDVSVLRDVDTSELQRFDVSALQKKFADDQEFVRQFIEGTSFAAFDPPFGAVQPKVAIGPVDLPKPKPPVSGTESQASEDVSRTFDGSSSGGPPSGAGFDDDMGGDAGAGATSLDEFFSKVGSSLVAAQRQLDQRSQEYMADLERSGMGRDLATLYRIPKVNAELKFALEDVSSEKLNLLIHSQGTQASTLNQQSVQFEIAAVPAPPEALEAARRLTPKLQWVFDPSRRQTIHEALAGSQLSSLPLDRWDRVLVAELGESDFLLAHAEAELGASFGLVHLDLSASAEWSTLYEVDGDGPDVPPPVRSWVAALCAQQATFLAGF